MLQDLGLLEDGALFGVEAGGQPVDDEAAYEALEPGRVGIVTGQGVPVRDEEIGRMGFLHGHPVLERAEIVPDMERPGGAHPRNGPQIGVMKHERSLREE